MTPTKTTPAKRRASAPRFTEEERAELRAAAGHERRSVAELVAIGALRYARAVNTFHAVKAGVRDVQEGRVYDLGSFA